MEEDIQVPVRMSGNREMLVLHRGVHGARVHDARVHGVRDHGAHVYGARDHGARDHDGVHGRGGDVHLRSANVRHLQ